MIMANFMIVNTAFLFTPINDNSISEKAGKNYLINYLTMVSPINESSLILSDKITSRGILPTCANGS